MIYRTLCMILMLLPMVCTAAYYDDHEKGWFWYKDESPFDEPVKNTPPPLTLSNASERMEKIKKEISAKRDLAILSGREEDLKDFIKTQYAVFGYMGRFTKDWNLIKIKYPELDYENVFPTSSVGREVYKENERKYMDSRLKALSKHVAFILFYDVDCPMCQKFAPIIKRLTDKYGFELLPISPDGRKFPSLPDTKPDNGLFQQFNVTSFPRLVILNKDNNSVIDTVIGLLPESEVVRRLLTLTGGN